MAFLGHIPYSPQTDPKALFAQGFKNYLGGLNQQLESRRFGKAIDESDFDPQIKQALSQYLTSGGSPRQAMDFMGMMSRNVTSPSQQISQKKLDHINMLQERVGAGTATAGEKAALGKMLEGQPLVQIGEKLLTPEQRQARAEKGFEEAMEDTPLSTPQLQGYGEAMDTRLEKAKLGFLKRPGRKNYPEKELFKQWKIFAGMHKFKNDTQKEQIWNVWQNKIRNRSAAGWFGEFFGKEAEIDPTDPKWRQAIGLKATTEKMQDATEDMTQLSDEELKRIAEGE